MKHFIIESMYLVPLEKIKEATPRHRSFLQKWYDSGVFLCSGPQDPPVGGFLVARANSLAELESILKEDPFQVENLARYRIREFLPVKRQSWAEEWFGDKSEQSV